MRSGQESAANIDISIYGYIPRDMQFRAGTGRSYSDVTAALEGNGIGSLGTENDVVVGLRGIELQTCRVGRKLPLLTPIGCENDISRRTPRLYFQHIAGPAKNAQKGRWSDRPQLEIAGGWKHCRRS